MPDPDRQAGGVAGGARGREFWERAIDFDFLVERGVLDADELSLFTFAESADEIWASIVGWYTERGRSIFDEPVAISRWRLRVQLTFLGAAGTVTGSKYLLEAAGSRILIDCGLYQGVKPLRLRNWTPLPFEPASLDAVLLTHAHVDHSGYLPALVRDGFAARCSARSPPARLCEILFPDAAYLQEEDASYANRKGFSKHRPALPLYTAADAGAAIGRLPPVAFDAWRELGGFRFRLQPAGHILGAAEVAVSTRAAGSCSRATSAAATTS